MYRPEGCRVWDKRWQHAREGLESWVEHRDIFEAGADAMLEGIWKMAEESLTKTFIFDANTKNIYSKRHLTMVVADRDNLKDVGEWAECQGAGSFVFIPEEE
jgi:hypothetical protein